MGKTPAVWRALLALFLASGLLAGPAEAVAKPPGRGAVVVESQIEQVRLFVGGGVVYFTSRPDLKTAFATALRKYIPQARITIVAADIQSGLGPSRRNVFVLTVESDHKTYQLTAESRRDYPTIEHDFRREMPAYLDSCARQLARNLKQEAASLRSIPDAFPSLPLVPNPGLAPLLPG